jgi:hypothetical protein
MLSREHLERIRAEREKDAAEIRLARLNAAERDRHESFARGRREEEKRHEELIAIPSGTLYPHCVHLGPRLEYSRTVVPLSVPEPIFSRYRGNGGIAVFVAKPVAMVVQHPKTGARTQVRWTTWDLDSMDIGEF